MLPFLPWFPSTTLAIPPNVKKPTRWVHLIIRPWITERVKLNNWSAILNLKIMSHEHKTFFYEYFCSIKFLQIIKTCGFNFYWLFRDFPLHLQDFLIRISYLFIFMLRFFLNLYLKFFLVNFQYFSIKYEHHSLKWKK